MQTLYGNQMGARKSYNPKNKGKKSCQPMLTVIAEKREYLWGELRNGDRPTGKQIYDHLKQAIAALPEGIREISARADSGFYCAEAMQAYEEGNCGFVIVARKTSRLVEQLGTSRLESFAENRCGRAMRVCLSTRRLGKGVPVCGTALRQGRGTRTGRGDPVPSSLKGVLINTESLSPTSKIPFPGSCGSTTNGPEPRT